MPVVRAQRQVRPDALPGVRLTAAETPTSLGAGLAAAKAGTAQALGDLGAGVARWSTDLYAQMHADEMKHQNDQWKIDATAKLDQVELALHDPTSGVYTMTGQSALTIPGEIDKAWNEATGAIAQGAGNDDQRTWLAAQKVQRGFNLKLTAQRYIDGELKAYDADLVKATVTNKASLAILHAQDPETAAYHMAVGVATIRNFGKRNGESPEVVDAKVAEFQSHTHEGIIANLLANQLTTAAKVHFEEARDAGQLTGEALTKMAAAVKAGTTDAQAEQAATDIWTQLGPKGDSDPISLDQMEEKARAKWGDNSDALKATIAALRTRKQAADDGRRERDGARNQAVWGAVLAGQSIDQIKRLPEFVDNPDVQLKVRDYLQREAEHKDALANAVETRAAAREGRAAAAENRAYTRELHAENERKMNGFAKFYDLDQPDSLRTLTPGAIQAMLPDLGHELVGKLLADQQQFKTSESKFLAARIDTNVFNEAANDAGLTFVYAKTKSTTQKANAGRLLDAVNAEVGRQTAKNGGPLTVDQQRAAAQSVIDQKVMTPGAWFGENEQIAAVVNKADEAKAYVPLAHLSLEKVTKAIAALRPFLVNGGQGMTDAQIVATHQRSIERAAAASMMGLGADEVLRRLKGGQ